MSRARVFSLQSLLFVALIVSLLGLHLFWPEAPGNTNAARIDWLRSLPAPAAGSIGGGFVNPADAYRQMHLSEWIAAVEQGENWIARPEDEEFAEIRDGLTYALVSSEDFDQYPRAVTIDIEAHEAREAIKYLVDNRPGILSVIYYGEGDDLRNLLVYWPEIAGNRLIYTPIEGASSEAVSSWVERQVAALKAD